MERFPFDSHGPGPADSTLTQPGGGTRPLGRHSTGHPRGGNSSTGGSLDTAPITAQSPARSPIGSSTRSPVTARRGAPIGTPPPHRFLESEVPGRADWSRGGRPATRNSKPGFPHTPGPREAMRRGPRRPSISAQSTEHGPSACPGSHFPGDGCLPRQGRFVSALVTLRSQGGADRKSVV